ncbi:hypothetical protein PC121_g23024 [Phytophthora cactorum]|nr:hypothetical protein PC121_g23024 [Phytophthora cactorum]
MRTRSCKLSPWGTQAKQLSMMSSRPRNGSTRAETIKTIVDGGIAVMAHIGLRPQHISVLGGFRAQGRTVCSGSGAVYHRGCLSSSEGRSPQSALALVFHDLLGMLQHPHHAQFVPKFCKRYADVGEQIRVGLENYRDDVESGRFSSKAYSPYKMSKAEAQKLRAMVADKYSANYEEEDEDGAALSEVTKVY